MKYTKISAVVAAVVLALCLVSFAAAADANNNDGNLFQNLYHAVEQIVVPSYDPTSGSPTQVVLFEMPGVPINRDEYDNFFWTANGFKARQPDAIAAQFVDRLPYYTGPVFVDSGSRISVLWGFFMYQYIIPIVDDPVEVAKVNAARVALANGTLQTNYDKASTNYEQSFNDFVNFRSNCLAKQAPGVCAAQAVIYQERLKRKWFALEVARRDIAAAEAKIIALQVQDLKNIFAESLYTYASNERIDMGGDGFGQTFYQTFLTPSNFYKWWPSTGLFNYFVAADGISSVVVTVPTGATITSVPTHGTFTAISGGNYTYTPNFGYTGVDAYTYSQTLPPNNITTVSTFTIQVVGSDVTAADTAFVTVSASSTSSSSESKSFTSQLSTTFDASVNVGLFSASGSGSTSNSKSSDSLTSSGSTFSMSFDLARVLITRPWLDTAILSFFPVAIRGIAVNGWSDGTITPAPGPLAFKFKLLPVAFLVARNIKLQVTLTQSMSNLQTAANQAGGSVKVGYGPIFSGSASASYASTSRDYQESASTSSNGLNIKGPQVIGWVCTPIPPFPTSDEQGVRTWEAQQIARQLAAVNVANAANGTGLTGSSNNNLTVSRA